MRPICCYRRSSVVCLSVSRSVRIVSPEKKLLNQSTYVVWNVDLDGPMEPCIRRVSRSRLRRGNFSASCSPVPSVYLPPPRGGVRSTAVSVYACLTVCMCDRISKPHVQTLRIFYTCYLRPWLGIKGGGSDNSATYYALPVSWMTSWFHIVGQIQIQS